jgi:hypothetical protein
MASEALRALLDSAATAIDEDKLKAAMRAYLGEGEPAKASSPRPSTREPRGDVSPRFLLQDILDDSILGAKAGDKSFPLRLLFSELSTRAGDDNAFTLLCALNVYFRIDADDEVKMRLGHEVSRLYYRFMDEARPEGLAAVHVSGLVAALLSTELQRVRLEAVDTAGAFDSQSHERGQGSDPASSAVKRPLSFLCRVPQTGMVRIKATVLT